jgi:hypothetical protein
VGRVKAAFVCPHADGADGDVAKHGARARVDELAAPKRRSLRGSLQYQMKN